MWSIRKPSTPSSAPTLPVGFIQCPNSFAW